MGLTKKELKRLEDLEEIVAEIAQTYERRSSYERFYWPESGPLRGLLLRVKARYGTD
jgi:hypothetical protein